MRRQSREFEDSSSLTSNFSAAAGSGFHPDSICLVHVLIRSCRKGGNVAIWPIEVFELPCLDRNRSESSVLG
jgi:hypothetical protein